MKTNLLIIIIMLLAPLTAAAAEWDNTDVKMWNEGDITWADFKGVPPASGNAPVSRFECTLDVKKENLGQGREYFAYAYMNKLQSYVTDSAVATPARLRYHQLQFDALEVIRRRFQNEIGIGMTDEQVQERLAFYRNMYIDQLHNIDKETNFGNDNSKVDEWTYFTQKNLEQTATVELPQTIPSNWGYGAQIGLGGIFPTGDINNTFNGNFTFNAGLLGSYRRIQLQATVTYGQPGLDNRNVFNVFDEAGRPLVDVLDNNASFLDFTVSLGYSIVKTRRFAITPHFGMFWGKYKWNATHLEWTQNDETGEYESRVTRTETQKFKDLNWMAGIDFDILLHTARSNDDFWFGRREQLSSSLRITPYVAHAVYNKENPAVKGYYVGFTVSYLGIARALKLR